MTEQRHAIELASPTVGPFSSCQPTKPHLALAALSGGSVHQPRSCALRAGCGEVPHVLVDQGELLHLLLHDVPGCAVAAVGRGGVCKVALQLEQGWQGLAGQGLLHAVGGGAGAGAVVVERARRGPAASACRLCSAAWPASCLGCLPRIVACVPAIQCGRKRTKTAAAKTETSGFGSVQPDKSWWLLSGCLARHTQRLLLRTC